MNHNRQLNKRRLSYFLGPKELLEVIKILWEQGYKGKRKIDIRFHKLPSENKRAAASQCFPYL
jgi:hypothetical protein